MKIPDPRRRVSQEEGAVAVITAIVLTVLIALMAFVVDYGLVRSDVRQSQNAADSASQAGVYALADGATFEEACQAAVAILESNLGISLDPDLCDPFAPGTFDQGSIDCTSRADSSDEPTQDPSLDAPVYVQDTDGDHTVRIQMPVRDSDEQMSQQLLEEEHDGAEPCQRVAVSVRRSRDLIFGQFAGGDGPVSGFADAVSRYRVGVGDRIVSSLVVLDPTHCEVLHTQGDQSSVLVGYDTEGTPGAITVDSDATSCSAGDYTLRVGGNGGRICAGVANLTAVVQQTEDCDSAPETLFSPSAPDQAIDPANAHQIFPEALAGDPITRAPIDHRYNCRSSYPLNTHATGENWHPHFGSVEPCDDNFGDTSRPLSDRNHIDQLATHFRPGTDEDDWVDGPGGWEVIDDCGHQNDHRSWGTPDKHLFIDCEVQVNNGSVSMTTAGYIVVTDTIDANGPLAINEGTDRDVAMVVNGTKGPKQMALFAGTQSDILFNRTFIFLRDGTLDIRSDPMVWSAPIDKAYDDTKEDEDDPPPSLEPENCDLQGANVPSPECFEDLGLWSNHEVLHRMTGGGGLEVEGIFFAPNAGLSDDTGWQLSGGSQEELTGAQFFSYRFFVTGNSRIGLTPDPDRNVSILKPVLTLIR